MPAAPPSTAPLPPKRGLRAQAGTLAALLYGLWCMAVLWWQPRSLAAVFTFLAPCGLFVCSWAWRRHRLLGGALALALPLLLWVAYRHYADRAELFYVAEYFVVYLTLCLWFASSLRTQPVITRVAQRVHALTPDMVAYTVKLTRAWAVYFLAMALMSLALYALAGLAAWGFFTLVLSPASLLGFLVIEHVLRYRWHPEFERASIAQAIRGWRAG